MEATPFLQLCSNSMNANQQFFENVKPPGGSSRRLVSIGAWQPLVEVKAFKFEKQEHMPVLQETPLRLCESPGSNN